jgi:hypothetical protein
MERDHGSVEEQLAPVLCEDCGPIGCIRRHHSALLIATRPRHPPAPSPLHLMLYGRHSPGNGAETQCDTGVPPPPVRRRMLLTGARIIADTKR